MKTRGIIQSEIVELSKQHNYLILELFTGCGKSKAFIDICKLHNYKNIMIFVSEISHIKNWRLDFEKYAPELHPVISCYHSIHKHAGTYDIIGLDECHHLSSLVRNEIIKYHCKHLIGMSATIPEERKFRLATLDEINPVYYTVTLQQGIDWKIIPKPEIFVKYINLNNDQIKQYLKLSNTIEFLKKKFYESRTDKSKQIWLNAGVKRKRFLSDIKTEAIKDLISINKERRFICFCGSIQQVKELGGEFAVHSRLSVNKCQELIDSFNAKITNSIFAVGKLREGINLTDIEVGIIGQLDNQEKSFIQMSGRVCTRGCENPVMYIVVVKDTQDEIYFKTATINIDKNLIYEME